MKSADSKAVEEHAGQALLARWAQEPLPEAGGGIDHAAQIARLSQVLGGVAEERSRRRVRGRWFGALSVAATVSGVALGAWYSYGDAGRTQTAAVDERALVPAAPESAPPEATPGARVSGSGRSGPCWALAACRLMRSWRRASSVGPTKRSRVKAP